MPLSKSQKRKQRLIGKGIALAKGSPPKQEMVVYSPPAQNSAPRSTGRRRRSRNRRRAAGRTGAAQTKSGGSQTVGYLGSLMNPDEGQGAKVPDEIGYPTGTFQLEYLGTCALGTGGDTVAVAFCPIIGNSTNSTYPILSFNGLVAGAIGVASQKSWGGAATVRSLYAGVRPVSAVLEFTFIGNTASDQGRLLAGCTYMGTNTIGNIGTTWDQWANAPDVEIFPSKMGARLVWKPLDNTNFEFVTPSAAGTISDRYPVLVAAATGLAAAPATPFQYRIVCNFEGVPSSDATSFVDTEPSPYNVEALKRAWAWAQEAGNNVRPIVSAVGTALEYGVNAYNMFNGQRRVSSNRQIAVRPSGFTTMSTYAFTSKLERMSLADDSKEEERAKSEVVEQYRDLGRAANESSTAPVSQTGTFRGEGLARTSSQDVSSSNSPRGRW